MDDKTLILSGVLLLGSLVWLGARLRQLRNRAESRAHALERVFGVGDSRPNVAPSTVVAGTIQGERELVAPLSGARCLAYRLRVFELTWQEDYVPEPRLVLDVTRFAEFRVESAVGSVEVKGQSGILISATSNASEESAPEGWNAWEQRLNQAGIEVGGLDEDSTYRLVEDVICRGAHVRAKGELQKEEGGSLLTGKVAVLVGDPQVAATRAFADTDLESQRRLRDDSP